MAMLFAPALRRTRLRLTPPRRSAHSWSPAPPAAASSLAFFDSHPRPRRRSSESDTASSYSSQNLYPQQALYGQLVVSALLRDSSSTPTTGASSSESSSPEPRGDPSQDPDWISDHEWELRTGRAIYILQQTLPDYFQIGLVSSLDIPDVRAEGDKPPASPSSSSPQWSIKSVLGLSDAPDTIGPDPDPPSAEEKTNSFPSKSASKGKEKDSTESIYSPRVRLSYTPPTPLPAPFPKTLHVEGLHLYIASSVFLRHTLNALYTDLHIDIRRVRVQGAGEASGSSSSAQPPPSDSEPSGKATRRRASREKAFVVGLTLHGIGRVSKAPVQWEVNCTYTFSPTSGLVLQHSIDSIEPAPTQALFEALGKFGLLGGGGRGGGAGVGS